MPGTEPDAIVRRYYALIDSRQFRAAWALLSDRQRDSLDYDQWVGGHVSTRSVQTPAVTILAPSDGVATVAVTRRFTGTWALIADGGEWKLDSPDIRLVDESRSVPADPSPPALAVPEPPVPPQSQPASASLDFDPSPYVNKGDAYNCGDFGSQKDAQSVLRADPRDPNRLDADKDGIACENNPLPRDMSPVPR